MSFPRCAVAGLLALLAAAVSACGGAQPTSSGDGGSRQLTIAVNEQFDGFDSTSLAGTNVQAGAMRQLYDTLVALGPDRRPQPRLAESWRFSPDRATLTLRLRKGLRFSDGSPLSAEDVVWNVEHAQQDDTAATAQALFLTIAKASAPDPRTVRLRFRQPLAAPFDLLDYLFIAKPQDDVRKLKTKPIGSGPFELERWTPGSEAVFVANPDYWRAGRPKLERVVFKSGSDRQAALTMFKSGQADFLFDSTWRDFDAFTRDSSVQTLKSGEGGRVEMILINARRAPFDQLKVRQAVAAALGRDAIAKTVYRGQSEPWCLPWPKGSIGYEASPERARDCPADPERARRLLAEAGFPDGLSTSIMTTSGEDADVTQVFQQQLAQAGIRARIESVEDAVFFDRAFRGDWPLLTSSIQRVAHDSATSILLGVPLQNGGVSGFETAEYGRLIDAVLHAAPAVRRKQAMRRLNDYLLEQAFILPVASQTPHYVMSKAVRGLQTTLDGYLVLEDATR